MQINNEKKAWRARNKDTKAAFSIRHILRMQGENAE